MRRSTGGALLTAGAAVFVALGPAGAVPVGPGPDPLARRSSRAADPAAAALLEAAAVASARVSYRGTQFVMLWSDAGASGAQVEVLHRAGEGSLLRVGATAQAPGRPVYRPASGGGEVGDPAGVDLTTVALLRRNYDAYLDGQDTVAGRPTDVVAVRRDAASPSARFWLDRETRLVLRREVYDADGRTLHAGAFISIDMTPPALPSTGNAVRMPAPGGVALTGAALQRLRDDGWLLPGSLPGGLELYEARLHGAEDERVVQMSYSDGVSAISLFEQRGRLDTGELGDWRRSEVGGAKVYEKPTFPRRIVWGGEGRVFTLVAECRQTTLAAIVGALPHGEDGRGVLDRLGHGLGRVGSWFNPFG